MGLTSIVLPAYVPTKKLLDVTKACLRSLRATTKRNDYQLVIVDNGSYYEASRYLLGATSGQGQENVYINLNDPVGYARAANIGLAAAQHDWLVVLNTDIEFTKFGWLETLRREYDETKGGILSAVDDGRQGLIQDESWFSCWLTRREVVQDVGYFDECLPYRFHDQDYAIRVKREGYEVMRTGNVQVKHIDSATYDTMGRDEDPGEQAEMLRRWGARDFAEWMRAGQPEPA